MAAAVKRNPLKQCAEAVLQFWLRRKYVTYLIMSNILFNILFKDGILSVLQRMGTEAFQ